MSYCERCDRVFKNYSARQQHRDNSQNHNICYTCELDFSSWVGLKEHWVQHPKHFYCQRCNEHFDTRSDLLNHYDSAHHFCKGCEKFFSSDFGLQEHHRQASAHQTPNHYYCEPCERFFHTWSNHQFHLKSSIHRPKDFACPGCGLGFVSRSALILHCESGSCRSGVDRAAVNKFVRKYDKNNIITDPSRLLTDGSGPRGAVYYPTPSSWNGDGYECYLCHNEYRSLRALGQHLNSPAHQDKIYLCPLSTCHIHFSTLSALCQHIESERCGVSKFRVVQDTMDKLMRGVGRITL